MRWMIQNTNIDPNNPTLVAAVRLLCILEFSGATMRWYVGEVAGRSDLPDMEGILALALNLASVGEAVKRFDEFVSEGLIKSKDHWPTEVKQAWIFLHGQEVQTLKQQHLLRVRNKSAFHIDAEPVKGFLAELRSEPGQSILLETSEANPNGFSPFGIHVIARWLLNHTMADTHFARLSSETYGALRKVIAAIISDLLPIHGHDA